MQYLLYTGDTLVMTHTSIPVNKLMALPNPVEERGMILLIDQNQPLIID